MLRTECNIQKVKYIKGSLNQTIIYSSTTSTRSTRVMVQGAKSKRNVPKENKACTIMMLLAFLHGSTQSQGHRGNHQMQHNVIQDPSSHGSTHIQSMLKKEHFLSIIRIDYQLNLPFSVMCLYVNCLLLHKSANHLQL